MFSHLQATDDLRHSSPSPKPLRCAGLAAICGYQRSRLLGLVSMVETFLSSRGPSPCRKRWITACKPTMVSWNPRSGFGPGSRPVARWPSKYEKSLAELMLWLRQGTLRSPGRALRVARLELHALLVG